MISKNTKRYVHLKLFGGPFGATPRSEMEILEADTGTLIISTENITFSVDGISHAIAIKNAVEAAWPELR